MLNSTVRIVRGLQGKATFHPHRNTLNPLVDLRYLSTAQLQSISLQTFPCLCTVKNTSSCCHRSLLSAEKNRTSLSQIQLILESLEAEKSNFSHVRSLHCCGALLKIRKCKSLYLINHNRQSKNSKKFTFLMHQAIYMKICTILKCKISVHCQKNQKTLFANILATV